LGRYGGDGGEPTADVLPIGGCGSRLGGMDGVSFSFGGDRTQTEISS